MLLFGPQLRNSCYTTTTVAMTGRSSCLGHRSWTLLGAYGLLITAITTICQIFERTLAVSTYIAYMVVKYAWNISLSSIHSTVCPCVCEFVYINHYCLLWMDLSHPTYSHQVDKYYKYIPRITTTYSLPHLPRDTLEYSYSTWTSGRYTNHWT